MAGRAGYLSRRPDARPGRAVRNNVAVRLKRKPTKERRFRLCPSRAVDHHTAAHDREEYSPRLQALIDFEAGGLAC